ncbi:DUF1707 domain-containing protein [Actinopolyspora mortivallis]|uniref:DUF1707 domain-containing protein n=1 Tax=Actinopolyspora mortivallis TaxID=33906 RepID=UPI000367DCC3|nr:DUF1707 domain-containing protein [Actinopolyspora mortivallis]
MTWQDELQQLDAELAAGRISADEYRQRRDTVLGRAHAEQSEQPESSSGGFPAQQPAWPQQTGFPGPGPGESGPHQSPFPPAFSWQQYGEQPQPGTQPPPQPPAGDSTQVVNVNQPPQQSMPPQGPASPPRGWPSSGQFPPAAGADQGAWGQQPWGGEAPGTPWGNADLPPEHGDTSWMRQGPEVFEAAGKSGKGKVVGLAVGGVLLAGVIVAVVFFVLSGQEAETPPVAEGQQQTTTSSTPTSTEPPLPEPPEAKGPPPSPDQVLIQSPEGEQHPYNGVMGPASLEGTRSEVLPPPVRDFALANGVRNGWFRGTDPTKNPIGTSLIAVKMPDEATAEQLTAKYREQQRKLVQLDDLSYQGVPVYSSGETLRTAYTTHSWMVIIEVRTQQAPQGEAQNLFTGLLKKQLAKNPPTVRE